MKCGRLVAKLTGICGASILASFLASPYKRSASQTILDFLSFPFSGEFLLMFISHNYKLSPALVDTVIM
jgi:hypothetical protein